MEGYGNIHEKITAIILTTVLPAALTGCNNAEENSESVPSSDNGSSSTAPSEPESSAVESAPESVNSSESVPSVSEVKQPDGEPTFLKGLDGEPIYTSEISQIFVYDTEKGERIPTDQLDRDSFSDVVCEGFTYVYIPRPSVDFMSDPKLFEASEEGDRYYNIGEELPDSSEFIRVNVGDKLGGLTVKAASSSFENLGYEDSEQFYAQGNIEFEGEVELTGFIVVSEGNPLYPESGGKILFYPDSESSVKIPRTLFDINYEDDYKARHYVDNSFYGWYGDGGGLSLGNISEIDSELRDGDMYVKVRVIVGDIVCGAGSTAVIREIDLI